MVLRLKTEEIDIMRHALDLEYSRIIRDLSAALPSHAAIELCRRRAAVEALLEQVSVTAQAAARSLRHGHVEEIPIRRDQPESAAA